MAIKKQEPEKLPDLPPAGDTAVTVVQPAGEFSIHSLFARKINGNPPVSNISLKRTLTKPLIAMAHAKELIFTCSSEVYIMELPSKDRKSEMDEVRVVDGVDEATTQECVLMLNELMAGAFKRGGYRTMVPDTDDKAISKYKEVPGNPLVGKSFAFREGVKKEGKGYRAIETVEVEITR